jgi:hypothetical protein
MNGGAREGNGFNTAGVIPLRAGGVNRGRERDKNSYSYSKPLARQKMPVTTQKKTSKKRSAQPNTQSGALTWAPVLPMMRKLCSLWLSFLYRNDVFL